MLWYLYLYLIPKTCLRVLFPKLLKRSVPLHVTKMIMLYEDEDQILYTCARVYVSMHIRNGDV